MPHKPGIGAIFGITAEDGVADQKRVVLMDRSNMKVVAQTIGDADGAYVFNGLNPDTDDYLVFSVDDNDAPFKEALVRDYIQPIPAYQGAEFPGNYYLLSRRLDPFMQILGGHSLGRPTSALPTSESSSFSDPRYISFAGSVLVDQPSLSPGAPQIPSYTLNGGVLRMHARPGGERNPEDEAYSPPRTDPFECAVEFLVDTSEGFSLACKASTVFSGNYASLDGETTPYIVNWNAGTKQLNFRLANTSGPDNVSSHTYDAGTLTLSGLTAGVHHILVNIRYADSIDVYVDSVLEGQLSQVGQSAQYVSQSGTTYRIGGFVVAGDRSASLTNNFIPIGSANFSVYTCYKRRLTPAQIEEIYSSLMVGSAPLVTGYTKEVVLDDPAIYIRAGQGDFATPAPEFLSERPFLSYGDLAFAEPSIVLGGATLRTGAMGGAIESMNCGGVIGHGFFTVELVLEPLSTLGAGETGYVYQNCSQTSAVLAETNVTFLLSLAENNRLRVRYYSSGLLVDRTFSRIFTQDEMRHVAIVMNAPAESLDLYVDGQFEETTSIPPTGVTTNVYSTPPTWAGSTGSRMSRVIVGARRNHSTGDLDFPANARIGEIAHYPHALTATRILAHYEARNVV